MLANGTYTHEHDVMTAERGVADGVIPVFYREKTPNPRKSASEGRQIYDEYDAVKMIIPGDKTSEHIELVKEEHKRRWPRQWQAYTEGREQLNGTPLEQWYLATNHPALIEELRALKVRTIEDLAALNDDFAARFPGGLDWRKKARAEIEKQKGLEAQLSANAELQAQLDEMKKTLAAMQKPEKQERMTLTTKKD